MYDPASKSWTVHRLPGDEPHAYAVYVDDKDKVWVSDFGSQRHSEFRSQNEGSRLSRATSLTPRYASSMGAQAKSGVLSLVRIVWS